MCNVRNAIYVLCNELKLDFFLRRHCFHGWDFCNGLGKLKTDMVFRKFGEQYWE